MHGMGGIRVCSCLVGECHQPGEGVSLSARREIGPHMHVDQSKNMVAKGRNVVSRTSLVRLGSFRLPAKSEDVNEHYFFSPATPSLLRQPDGMASFRIEYLGRKPFLIIGRELVYSIYEGPMLSTANLLHLNRVIAIWS